MVRTTKAQRTALKRAWDRNAPTRPMHETYRWFRRQVQTTFGCDGAVVVPWCGMWLIIEKCGYTHS